MTTTTTYSDVANTIREQMGVFGLGVVGASHLGFMGGEDNLGALSFKARIHVNGSTRASVVRVTLGLTPADLYRLDVYVAGRGDKPGTTVNVHDGIFAGDLTKAMYDLDSNGVSTR
jgi:hypothetical protein